MFLRTCNFDLSSFINISRLPCLQRICWWCLLCGMVLSYIMDIRRWYVYVPFQQIVSSGINQKLTCAIQFHITHLIKVNIIHTLVSVILSLTSSYYFLPTISFYFNPFYSWNYFSFCLWFHFCRNTFHRSNWSHLAGKFNLLKFDCMLGQRIKLWYVSVTKCLCT
jgi:hypothetical protein